MLQGAADVKTNAPLQVAVDLAYTTASPCHSITELPSSSDALATSLLPTSTVFRGKVRLSTAASDDGCKLYLTIKGVVSATTTYFHDAFDVARSVHQQMMELLNSKGLENVALARAAVDLDGNKLLAVSLKTGDSNPASKSVVKVQKGDCKELLDTLQAGKDTDMLLPRDVWNVTTLDDADETAGCVVAMDIAAIVPCINVDAEAFQLLQTVDEKVERFFAGQSSAVLARANVQLYVASTGMSEALNLAMEEESVNATNAPNVTLNPPSSKEALGIFALVAVLVAMMMSVMVLKKRNDRRSRERYERANQAAQIRRVSICMSQYDQNESEDYEGEEDSLL